MKLVDILVEELPKRGGWPENTDKIHQDHDGVCYLWHNYSCRLAFNTNDISDNHRPYGIDESDENMVTRTQYEAALAAKNDGWITWGGGECHADGGEIVNIRHRDGCDSEINSAGNLRWTHAGWSGDIIAYRLHKPADVKPEWSGEGLPPVGCECEYSLNNGRTWFKCKIEYIVGSQGVVMSCDVFEGIQYASTSQYDLKFRPLRTEADRKRDAEVNELIDAINLTLTDIYASRVFMDAIRDRKIPGVKLDN